MALSQKHRGKILVPWFCSDEWRMVYNLIYSESSTTQDKENALNMLQIWKTRTPLLFAGLEGTLTVLEVLLLDESKLQENVLCSLYATAILRFLNISATSSDRQGTFYQSARKKNLPDWLINIRHDLAHSQKLPSKFMLNFSLKYCLNWLKSMYWDLQNNVIEDYIVNELDVKSNIEEVIRFFCNATFTFLNGEDAVDLHFERIRQLGLYIKKSTPFVVVQKNILNVLGPVKLPIESDAIVDCIIENGNIFLVPESLIQTGKNKHIPQEVFKAWETLLLFLEKQNLLMKLVEKFFNIIYNENTNNDIKLKTSLWLDEIFKSLLKKQMDYAIVLNGNYDVTEFNNRKNKKIKAEISNTFNFAGHNPSLIKELEKFKDNVSLNPNKYMEIYLKNLLLVVGCPKSFISDMELAMKSFLQVNHDFIAVDKLYTLEDVDKLLKNVMVEEGMAREDEIHTQEINYAINGDDVLCNGKRWQRVQDTSFFDGFPLGVLPHQHNKNKNPIL